MLNKKILNATKWSSIAEITSKLIVPVINIVLARLISVEAFAIIAIVTMIVSFADLVTDAGFQKYLIQHEFEDENKLIQSANVAFWTNLGISIIIYIFILMYASKIANLLGILGYENVIIVSALQLFFTSFSSVQVALHRREFDFKILCYLRIVSVIIPLLATIPLAYYGYSYWSIIIGNLLSQFITTLILAIRSKWKPKIFYKFDVLKKMFSFSAWSLMEAISIWLTSWIDIFLISKTLSQHHVGIYRTATLLVNSLMGLVIAIVIPILFTSLSRVQHNKEEFEKIFFIFQRAAAIIILPLSIGIYIYRDLVTKLLLGKGWDEAALVIGIWGLSTGLMMVIGYFSSEVYRAKGKANYSFLSQVAHLLVLVPACIYFSKYEFKIFVYIRSGVRLQFIAMHLFILSYIFEISFFKILKNIYPIIFSGVLMGILGYFTQNIYQNILWDFITILICIVFYFSILLIFPNIKKDYIFLYKKMKVNKQKEKI